MYAFYICCVFFSLFAKLKNYCLTCIKICAVLELAQR